MWARTFFRRTFGRAYGPDWKPNRAQKIRKARGHDIYFVCAFVGCAALWLYYLRSRRREMPKTLMNEHAKSVGSVSIGGPFSLVDMDGKPVTWASLRGKFVLMYFGFTNCPDICPDELLKLSRLVACLDEDPKIGPTKVVPLFVTIDPARDSIQAVREYLRDFHPRIVGLTGTPDLVDAACRMFRVYYSVPGLDHFTDTDYLVDHSIMTYLFAPDGTYLDHVHKEVPGHVALTRFRHRIQDWKPSVSVELVSSVARPTQSVAAVLAGATAPPLDEQDAARAAERRDAIGKGTIDFDEQMKEHGQEVLINHVLGTKVAPPRPEFGMDTPTRARL